MRGQNRSKSGAWIAGLIVVVGATSCVDDAREHDAVAARSSALTNSEVDEGHPGVVTFRAQGFIFCTGTVIAPRIVLTAGHCMSEELTGVAPEEIEVFFGTDPGSEEGTYIQAVEGAFHPDWTSEDLYNGLDVGLLRLAEDAPAAPTPIGAAPAVDMELTLVGFGESGPDGTGGVKRVGGAVVTATTDALFDIAEEPSALCHGDSGGPALALVDGVETIVGVGSLGSCAGRSVEQRVDLHIDDFILPWAASCEDDGLCAPECDAPDPDCSGSATTGATTGGASTSAASVSAATGGEDGGDGEGGASGAGGTDDDPGTDEGEEDGGGCSVGHVPAGRAGGLGAGVVVIAALGLRRRRR